jgi:hypothetical protein
MAGLARAEGQKAVGPMPSDIPLWVRATGGARAEDVRSKTNGSVIAQIERSVDTCLKPLRDFKWSDAKVLDGYKEGAYAWLGLEYLRVPCTTPLNHGVSPN